MSAALDGAERKGAEAFQVGLLRSDNPYADRRTSRGAVTWSRAFRKAWDDGWVKAEQNPQGERLNK